MIRPGQFGKDAAADRFRDRPAGDRLIGGAEIGPAALLVDAEEHLADPLGNVAQIGQMLRGVEGEPVALVEHRGKRQGAHKHRDDEEFHHIGAFRVGDFHQHERPVAEHHERGTDQRDDHDRTRGARRPKVEGRDQKRGQDQEGQRIGRLAEHQHCHRGDQAEHHRAAAALPNTQGIGAQHCQAAAHDQDHRQYDQEAAAMGGQPVHRDLPPIGAAVRHQQQSGDQRRRQAGEHRCDCKAENVAWCLEEALGQAGPADQPGGKRRFADAVGGERGRNRRRTSDDEVEQAGSGEHRREIGRMAAARLDQQGGGENRIGGPDHRQAGGVLGQHRGQQGTACPGAGYQQRLGVEMYPWTLQSGHCAILCVTTWIAGPKS
ncbi:hypothetical protein ASE00_03730 [Sphingomonas sp. Root710]|nr:hypothetical protein ASE00_03730 [Sphingomonas sp. Root710]